MLALLAVLIVPQGSVSAVPPCPEPESPRPNNPCPGWEWVTFLGGEGKESGNAIAADSDGNAYVAGMTTGHDFPVTLGSLDTSYNGDFGHVMGGDIFVVKLSADGSGPVYATLLGGSDVDYVTAIAVDSEGNAYLTGFTRSSDFPTTPGSYDAGYGGSDSGIVACERSGGYPHEPGYIEKCSPYGGDAFVVKLNAAGTALIYSTFLGGRGSDIGTSIAVDSSGNAYVTGDTAYRVSANDFPTTPGAFDSTFEGSGPGTDRDAFLAKVNAPGSALVYSTLLGGSGDEAGGVVSVDSDGSAYLTGSTRSIDFPTTPDAFDESYNGEYDVFVARLNEAGSALVYSTYLGGSDWDTGRSLAIDSAGSAYVTGETRSTDFPTTSGVFDRAGDVETDAFVAKLSPTASSLVYSTFLGGGGEDRGDSIVVDEAGNAFVTGGTRSTDFPTTFGAYDAAFNGGKDGFFTKLEAGGDALNYSTMLGGAGEDWGFAIAIDSSGIAYVAGRTFSDTLSTTPGAYDSALSGDRDALVAKLEVFDHPDRPPTASFTVIPISGEEVATFLIDASSSLDTEDLASALQVRWDWESDGVWDTGWATMQPPAFIQFATPGERAIRLEVKDSGGFTDSATRKVSVEAKDIPPADTGPPVILPLSLEVAVDASGGTVPFTASFQATPSGGAPPYSFLWDFGDGSASTLPNPSHTYQAPGTYTTTLTLTDAEGHETTSVVQITVYSSIAGGPRSDILPAILYAGVALSLGAAGILLWARRHRARRPPPGT